MINQFTAIFKKSITWFDLKAGNVSVETVAVIAISLLFAFATIYSTYVYVQFSRVQILGTSLFFLILFIGLIFIFTPWVVRVKYIPNLLGILLSILIFCALILWLFSPDKWVLDYFRTFPTIEAELGLGWHIDTTFHVAIINSINTFGYPSTGQHDVPILYYHVLSHYVEALIINIIGINAWDSYGMFFYFKRVMVLSAIIIFISTVCRKKAWYVFVISIFTLIPLIAATWHLVGSHGLWVPTLLIIFSAPIIYRLLNQEKRLNLKDYIFLFSVLILVSLGKVSSGLSYSLVIGFLLVLRDWRDFRVYIFGSLLFGFFLLFSSKFILGGKGFEFVNISELFKFLFLKTNEINNQLYQVYVLIFIVILLAVVFRFRSLKKLLLSSVISVLTLALYFNVAKNSLSSSDIFYFIYGLYSVLLLIVYQELINTFDNVEIKGVIVVNPGARSYNLDFKPFLVIGIFLLVGKMNLTYINLHTINFASIKNVILSINTQPFEQINLKESESKATVLKQMREGGFINFANYPVKYRHFRNALSEYMEQNRITSKDTLLYLSREAYSQEPNSLGAISWARGLFLYAFTGVPLIYGVSELRGAYGYSAYKISSSWVMRSDFNESEACRFKKNIVIIENFDERKFSFIKCK